MEMPSNFAYQIAKKIVFEYEKLNQTTITRK